MKSVLGRRGVAPSWSVQRPFGWRTLIGLVIILVIMGDSAHRLGLERIFIQTGEAIAASVGLQERSQLGDAVGRITGEMFPITIEERKPVTRIENFDEARLPPFSHLESVDVQEQVLNSDTLQLETVTHTQRVLVEPAGYLLYVLTKMVETIEIAIWATIFAIVMSLPLAYLSARNYTPHFVIYGAARGVVSFFRSMPELITALFLVIAFGFGPVAGILALTLHGAGFLGKFYADDIEAADKRPQEALQAIGAGQLSILRLAVIPQVLPSFTAQTLYLLDRNIRMAAVVGLVGGGGIGQELKGRYDLFEYDRVGTILLVLFITVVGLDQIASRIRRHLLS
ncbi:phosphonate ABC transporter, permease protein PhnE [Woodsholea maritima]|uniref:phosphonate ABC transporter, permease protein PhnE n=1 Tax=Woodsholea maritima TaxID=240237 RepID=UPI00037B86D0|nr:phosphonate ABC transporter, permease protein PhnE [Woodsholea maritima]